MPMLHSRQRSASNRKSWCSCMARLSSVFFIGFIFANLTFLSNKPLQPIHDKIETAQITGKDQSNVKNPVPTEHETKKVQIIENDHLHTKNDDSISSEILDDYKPNFDLPGWNCKSSDESPSPSRKLIFVHVFKTAGSSLRSFFFSYGKNCGKGVSLLIGCSEVSAASIKSTDPNQQWEPCKHKLTRKRNNDFLDGKTISRHHLQKYADILMGHLPVGVHEGWMDTSNEKPIVPQYIAFFRDPYAKFVSSQLFINKMKSEKKWLNEHQALIEIKEKIHHMSQRNSTYNAYSKYLTTPEQKFFGEKMKFTKEDWSELVKKNLIKMNIIVGIVEDMNESMELMQSIIDVDKDITPLFESLIRPEGLIRNKSRISTSNLVKSLKTDEETWHMLTEVLKFEIDLYNFAIKLHKLQVDALRKIHGDKYTFS